MIIDIFVILIILFFIGSSVLFLKLCITKNKNNLYKKLFIFLYSFVMINTPIIFVYIITFFINNNFIEIILYLYLCLVILLFLAPILKLINSEVRSQKFENVIKLCFVPFYVLLIMLNCIIISII